MQRGGRLPGGGGWVFPLPHPLSSAWSRAALRPPSVDSRTPAQSCSSSQGDASRHQALTLSAHSLRTSLAHMPSGPSTPQIAPLLVHPDEWKWGASSFLPFIPCSPSPLGTPIL